MKAYHYIVAGHCFSVLAAEGLDLDAALSHYAPFSADPATAPERVFSLNVVPENGMSIPQGLVEEMTQDDDGSQIRICRTPEGESWLEFSLFGNLAGRMIVRKGLAEATLAACGQYKSFALGNALMVMYAMSTARMGTALFHAAVIGNGGAGYLFLGKSGTGKSTHARLWLKHIPGSELVNDDNPVVRVLPDGTVRVYGSPWSGKTPCYKNMDLPVGAFVQLSQAPYNKIERLKGISAYAALVPGISGKRWDKAIADGLHETENFLASNVPVWHLECLPDEAAAQLCAGTIRN